jgi:hypothetical protein
MFSSQTMILTCSLACALKEMSILFTSITVIIESVLPEVFYITSTCVLLSKFQFGAFASAGRQLLCF